MKKVVLICCALAALLVGVSCEKNPNAYKGTNYIYLSAESNMMYDTEDAALNLTVELTTSLAEDLQLTFKTDDTDNVITLEGNPVTIKAGEKTATLTVKTALLTVASKNFKITLDEATTLPEKVVWKEDFVFTVNSSLVAELTDAQKAIVEAYKTKTGIDLSKYLGLVSVKTVYTASNPDSEIPLPAVNIEGITAIALSEASTAEKPVLKMTVNPMGIYDVTYAKFKAMTVENPYWLDPEAYPSYSQLMTAINWNKDSDETFTMTLDGITLNADKSVDFLLDESYYDAEWEETVEMVRVPFEYSFTAYEREQKALAEGKIGVAVDEYWSEDATANPAYHINSDNVASDGYEYGNWTASSASLSAEKLEFTFCIYNYQDYDYTKVIATYTPNK